MNTTEEQKREFEEMFKPEELHPELALHLVKCGRFPALRHPLVYDVPYFSALNARHNKMLACKKKELEKAQQAGDLSSYVWLHERPYRLQAFTDFQGEITDKDYWETLGSIWIDSENIWQNLKGWKALLSSSHPEREFFMDDGDRAALAKLRAEKETVTVYRGHQGLNRNGLSWTLDRDKARWFSRRLLSGKKKGEVAERTVNLSDVFAYLGGRGEQEIILLKKGNGRT